MTRGRKKDMTLPATRALTQQRDYRARKAQYLNDLERRLHESETENRRLRVELDALKNGSPLPPLQNIEAVRAFDDLQQQLMRAQEAVVRVQNLARVTSTTTNPFPSPAPSPPFYSFMAAADAAASTTPKRLFQRNMTDDGSSDSDDPRSHLMHPRDLAELEEEEDEITSDTDDTISRAHQPYVMQVSSVRSTSDVSQ